MKKLWLCLVLILLANVALARSTERRTEDKVKLYNFSPALMKAAKDCSPYKENFSNNNKKFFEAPTKVLVYIHGKEKERCHFTVKLSNYYWPMMSHIFDCRVTPQEQKEILEAMKNKSTKLEHEVINYTSKLSPNLSYVTPDEQVLDITAGHFTVLINKVFRTKCTMDWGDPF